MAPNKSEENQAKDGSVKVHIGPEVVCDDVEKVKNEIKLNCCKLVAPNLYTENLKKSKNNWNSFLN